MVIPVQGEATLNVVGTVVYLPGLVGVYVPSAFLLLPLVTEAANATVPEPLLAVTAAVAFFELQLPLAVIARMQVFPVMVAVAVAPAGLKLTAGALAMA